MSTNTSSKPKPINLALQGGGAHGAFTWGVLDTILEDERVEIEAISGTSAGAMNAVVLADGMMESGREGGRRALEAFWVAVGRAALASPIKRSVWDMLTGNWSLDFSPSYLFFDLLSRVASPYQLNPLNLNPLRDLVLQQVDLSAYTAVTASSCLSPQPACVPEGQGVQACGAFVDAVMASACLPLLFQAVEIGGEAYWDEGYMGIPCSFRFSTGVVIPISSSSKLIRLSTRIYPPRRLRSWTVSTRSFNSSLISEFRAIDFVARLLDQGALDPKRYKRVLLHIIYADQRLAALRHRVNSMPNGPFYGICTRWAERRRASGWTDTLTVSASARR